MGKRSAARIAGALVLVLAVSAGALARTVEVSFDPHDFDVRVDSDGTIVARIAGGVPELEPGGLDLPWVPVRVLLEDGERVVSWGWEPYGGEVLTADGAPRMVPADPRLEAPVVEQERPAARFLGVSTTRGRREAVFHVSPFEWDAGLGLLARVEGGRLEITSGEDASIEAVVRSERVFPDTPLRAGQDAGLALKSWSLREAPRGAPSLDGSPVEYLVITTAALAEEFQWLVDWKNRCGLTAALRTIEEIEPLYPQAVDRPERIRLFLRDATRYWGTQTVLLAADPNLLPIRFARSYAWNFPEGVDIATDHYYACLDGNWNANGNALYGESQRPGHVDVGDNVDLRPELSVGRVPASTPEEAATWIRKYQMYVTTPPNDGYYNDVLVLGEVLFDADWRLGDCDECNELCPIGRPCVQTDGAEDCFAFLDSLAAAPVGLTYDVTERYERLQWWLDHGRPATQELRLGNVLGDLNGGTNIVFHSGHGDRDRWAIGQDRVESIHLRGLDSDPRYGGIVYSINCNSAAVEYDCAGEAWLFSEQGGGLAYVGSTNLDFPSAAAVFRRVFQSRWPGDGFVTPGSAFTAAADDVAALQAVDRESTFRFLLYSLIFLGDPDMHVWLETPRPLTVTYPAQVELGSPVNVTVQASGTAVPRARVALYKAGDAMVLGETNAAGMVTLPFPASSAGSFLVTVTHPSGVPHQGSSQLVAGAVPYASVDGIGIDDVTDGGAGIVGNGNGQLEVGETVALDLEYSNRGGAATTLDATLSVSDSSNLDIQLLDDEAALGPVGSGASGTLARAFLVKFGERVDADRERDRQRPEFVVSFTSQAGANADEIALECYRPLPVLHASHLREMTDAGGTLDGIPESGDVWRVALEYQNLGHGSLESRVLRLYRAPFGGNGINVFPSTIGLPPAGYLERVVSDSFQVHFNITGQTNLRFSMLDASADSLVILDQAFDFAAPAPPESLSAQGRPSSIGLLWDPPPGDDIYAYRVFRSSFEAGPFEIAGTGLVPRTSALADSGYYSDEGLPPLTDFYYRVSAIDLSGNESLPSDVIAASTSPGAIPGWPVTLNASNANAPTIEEVNGFGGFEVLTGTDVLYAFLSDGSDYYDGDNTPSTRGVLTLDSQAYDFRGKPAVADLDGDGEVEIIACANYRSKSDQSQNPPVRNADLIVFDRFGRVVWRKAMVTAIVLSSPAIGDIDGDGDPEVVILADHYVYAFHDDGTPVGATGRLYDIPLPNAWWMYGSVALGDVFGDEAAEIVFTARGQNDAVNTRLYVVQGNGQNVPGFPYLYANDGSSQDGSNSSPAIADVDGEAKGEIFVTTKHRLWMFDPNHATRVMRWFEPVGTYASIELNSSPALGDIDRDGDVEVVVGGASGRLFVLDALTGVPMPAFTEGGMRSIQIAQSIAHMGSPILGDLTGDGRAEIVIGDSFGNIYVYQHDGTQLGGFPYKLGGQISTGLAMWDVDKNGTVNLIGQANQLNTLVVLDFPGSNFDHANPDFAAYPWTQFRHDSHNTGLIDTSPVLPLALAAPELSSAGGLDVEVRWFGQPGFERFELYRRPARLEEFELVGAWTPLEVQNGSDSEFRVVDAVPEPDTYVYRIVGVEPDGFEVTTAERQITITDQPLSFALHGPRPNPFAATTSVQLDLPRPGQASLRVLDPSGRVVRVLQDGALPAGSHVRVWDGRDGGGHLVPAGIYFLNVIAAGQGEGSTKIVHLR